MPAPEETQPADRPKPIAANDLLSVTRQFHRTIQGIRQVVDAASPHLGNPLRDLAHLFRDLTPDQRGAGSIFLMAMFGRAQAPPALPDESTDDAESESSGESVGAQEDPGAELQEADEDAAITYLAKTMAPIPKT